MNFTTFSILFGILSCLATTATTGESQYQDIDSILSAAFEIVDFESHCAKLACEVSNALDPSVCTPVKINKYRLECADVMERAGMKKKHEKMTPETEHKVREMMKLMEPSFSAVKLARAMEEDGEFDVSDLWQNMGKFEL